ncbi:hypothetical protein Bhyg_03872 [Pseudolycoriella hygida]|uniref:Uncharacterized protein n=1 Tax=Pseudolycoriella hygida TaxID=35572 RepID=A0A9Q0NE36_9DIPT|nr:hypothetical protein Bhyg_03872 [Pseudolycoriella hygida]
MVAGDIAKMIGVWREAQRVDRGAIPEENRMTMRDAVLIMIVAGIVVMDGATISNRQLTTAPKISMDTAQHQLNSMNLSNKLNTRSSPYFDNENILTQLS